MRIVARMGVSGPSLQAQTLLSGLDPDRFDQRLYCGSLGEGEEDYLALRAPGTPVHTVPGLRRSIGPQGDVRAFAHLVGEMRRFRPHIVHTHTAKAGALGRVAAALCGVPVRMHTFHGHLLYGYFTGPKLDALVMAERALARLSHRLVAVGTQVRDDLLAAGIGTAEKFAVIPPGTRVPPPPERAAARHALGLPSGAPVVAFIGRVTAIKRPDRFLEVARLVRRALPEAHFVVCGDGDLSAEMARQGADLGAALHMLGWRADLAPVHAAADVILLTSDNEGTPVALIEAALSGVPAVATRVGSVAEVVEHGVTGLVVPSDAAALAEEVERLLRDGELRRRMGAAARTRAEALFGIDRFVADVGELYESLVAERVPRPRSTTSR